jgi:hypothetical protein
MRIFPQSQQPSGHCGGGASAWMGSRRRFTCALVCPLDGFVPNPVRPVMRNPRCCWHQMRMHCPERFSYAWNHSLYYEVVLATVQERATRPDACITGKGAVVKAAMRRQTACQHASSVAAGGGVRGRSPGMRSQAAGHPHAGEHADMSTFFRSSAFDKPCRVKVARCRRTVQPIRLTLRLHRQSAVPFT